MGPVPLVVPVVVEEGAVIAHVQVCAAVRAFLLVLKAELVANLVDNASESVVAASEVHKIVIPEIGGVYVHANVGNKAALVTRRP